LWLGLWCLIPLSTIFQLNGGSQFLLVEETWVSWEKTNMPQVTDKLYRLTSPPRFTESHSWWGVLDIYNIRTLSVNIKFMCTSFRNRQKWCGYANAFIMWVKQSNVHSANCVPYIFMTFKLCSQRNLCDFNCLIFIFIMMWILQDETML
jgi:hypothetical protein